MKFGRYTIMLSDDEIRALDEMLQNEMSRHLDAYNNNKDTTKPKFATYRKEYIDPLEAIRYEIRDLLDNSCGCCGR